MKKRKGFKFIADYGKGPPLRLVKDGDRVKVLRDGKVVGYLTKAGLIRAVAKADRRS